jgi:hypothetical protein
MSKRSVGRSRSVIGAIALPLMWLVIAASSTCPGDEPKAKPRISLRLDSAEVLLGEPILVERRVEVDGPGLWEEPVGSLRGGRGGGIFLMRHEDGSWVADTFEGHELQTFGGIGGTVEVKKGEPHSEWQPVQEWCAIERPGVYDLYAIGWGIDPAPKLDPPLADDVLARIKATGRKGEIVRFTLTVRQGDEKQRRAMVERWIKETEEGDPDSHRDSAARTAMALARQNDFLPELERRLRGQNFLLGYTFIGLAMRDDPRAVILLFEAGDARGFEAMRFLHPNQVPNVIPRLIDQLTDPDHTTRANAEEVLRGWTSQSFDHSWNGYDYKRPTLEEGRAMQPMYREWWDKNRKDFRPKFRRQ